MTQTTLTPTTPDTELSPPLIHLFRRPMPPIGSVALCGWVKQTPPNPDMLRQPPDVATCVVCRDLSRRLP